MIENISVLGVRVDLDNSMAKLNAIKGVIDAGGSTDDLDEYLTDFRFLKFSKDGKDYIQLTRLLDKLKKEHTLFKNLTLKELQQLLRKSRTEPVRYGHKTVRLWLLPNTDTTDGLKRV